MYESIKYYGINFIKLGDIFWTDVNYFPSVVSYSKRELTSYLENKLSYLKLKKSIGENVIKMFSRENFVTIMTPIEAYEYHLMSKKGTFLTFILIYIMDNSLI